MNIMDILNQTQGGSSLSQIGQKFGLDDQQTHDILKEIMPRFGEGIQKQARQKGGLENIFDMIQDDDKNRYADDPQLVESSNITDIGNDILGGIFGNKDGSRQVASEVAQKTGVSDAVIKGMLPYIAPMVIGALSKKFLGKGIGGVVGSVLGGRRGTVSSRLGAALGRNIFKILGSGFVMKMIGKYMMKRMFR